MKSLRVWFKGHREDHLGYLLVTLLAAALYLSGCQGTVTSTTAAPEIKGISAQGVSGVPDVFCTVTKEPDPLLLGGWKCIHHKFDMRINSYVDDRIEYWLGKFGDRYGLYFFRVKAGEKTYQGWRECTINGNKIANRRAGFEFFAENGAVFYNWTDAMDKPTRMTRIEGN